MKKISVCGFELDSWDEFDRSMLVGQRCAICGRIFGIREDMYDAWWSDLREEPIIVVHAKCHDELINDFMETC